MTDKDMLELAAMAAGMVPLQWVDSGWLCETQDSTPRFIWNSLDSSADAFELAVQLGLDIRVVNGLAGWSDAATDLRGVARQPHNGSPIAATRRAITRAAAAMAKE